MIKAKEGMGNLMYKIIWSCIFLLYSNDLMIYIFAYDDDDDWVGKVIHRGLCLAMLTDGICTKQNLS